MNDIKPVIRITGVFFLIWAVYGMLNLLEINSKVPEVEGLTTLMLIGISVFQIRFFDDRLSGFGPVQGHLKGIAWVILLWVLLRCAKYYPFKEFGAVPRYIWYCYYIPMLLISVLSFFAALNIGKKDMLQISRYWGILHVIVLILVVLILTNDLHQLAFSFNPGFEGWDYDYSHGPVYFAAMTVSVLLFAATAVVLVIRCSITEIRRLVWIPITAITMWHAYLLLLSLGIVKLSIGYNIFEYPEAACFSIAAFWGYAIVIGIVPTNENYSKLIEECSLSVQLANKKYVPIYKSKYAADLTDRQLRRKRYSVIDENTRLYRVDVTGGYGYWQQDISELNRLNEELAEVRGRLMDEAEIIRYENELKAKKVSVETRNRLYDGIAGHVHKQIEDISIVLKSAQDYPQHYDVCVSFACVLGAYIKRSANLMILAEKQGIPLAELRISIVESLRYLNFMNIPGDCIGSGDKVFAAPLIICLYDAFENLLEAGINDLKAMYVSLAGEPVLSMKLSLEGVGSILSQNLEKKMLENGFEIKETLEDGVCYVRITHLMGGESTC